MSAGSVSEAVVGLANGQSILKGYRFSFVPAKGVRDEPYGLFPAPGMCRVHAMTESDSCRAPYLLELLSEDTIMISRTQRGSTESLTFFSLSPTLTPFSKVLCIVTATRVLIAASIKLLTTNRRHRSGWGNAKYVRCIHGCLTRGI